MNKSHAGIEFQRLVNLMDVLREKCPWDKKQTIKSLQKYTIEELYELIDAINKQDNEELKGELGDILFHTIFYSRIASETDLFSITDVIINVHEKLVRRHPHIFGNTQVKDEKEVSKNWEQIKLKEGNNSILSGVPKSLPAITKAYRVQEKTAQVGFDFGSAREAYKKVEEEKLELEEAKSENNKKDMQSEFGDLLFALINYARLEGLDPEAALEETNQKFIKRFSYVEREVLKSKKEWESYSLEELDEFWNKAKSKE